MASVKRIVPIDRSHLLRPVPRQWRLATGLAPQFLIGSEVCGCFSFLDARIGRALS